MFDEICEENNARRVGQTHNNKKHPFGAMGFTEARMTFLMVENKNVSFTLGIMTFLGPSGHLHA